MNIACDARALVGRHTGVGTWTTQVMAGLAGQASTGILLCASKPVDLPEELNRPNIRTAPTPRLPIPGTVWLQLSLPRLLGRSNAEVFIGSLAIVPLRSPAPTIAMVHDLTPLTHPHRHTLRTRLSFKPLIGSSLTAARAVVVGSTATRDVLLDRFPDVEHRLHVIGYGVDPFFSPSDDPDEAASMRRQFSDGRSYILHLGTLEPRKGVTTLIEAWGRLHDLLPDPPDLVLAGDEGWGMRDIQRHIEASPHADRIHRPGYVDREHARALMRHAAVFVLASEVEGFGLPLAEAIACGAPTVASDIPALRESGGPATVFTPAGDAAALARILAENLEPARRERLRAASLSRRKLLGWDPVIAAWRELIQSVVEERSRE